MTFPGQAGSLTLALASVTSVTRAAPAGHVELSWSQGDPRCIGANDLASTVERTLGRAVFHSEVGHSAKVIGSIARHDTAEGFERYEAYVAIEDPVGATVSKRTLEVVGPCERLDEAIAVVVTLMVDGLEEVPAPIRVPAEPPRPPPPAPSSGTLVALRGAAAISSFLPGVVGAAVLHGEVAAPRFVPLALAIRVYTPSDGINGSVGGTFSAWTAELTACPRVASASLSFAGCVGVGSGATTARSVGFTQETTLVRPSLFTPLLLEGGARLFGPVWGVVEAGAFIPWLRERWGFVDPLGSYQVVYRVAPVVPTASIGIEIRTRP
jgi:hypothetical protein